ncbi:hypothetical protein AB0I98_49730, partial [Streptomyces sp. NPDC050211]
MTVQVVCPLGVRTEIYEQSDAAAKAVLGGSVLAPEDVADEVMKGLAYGRFLILPHGEGRGRLSRGRRGAARRRGAAVGGAEEGGDP